MESHRTNQALPVSQAIDKSNLMPEESKRPRRPSSYEMLLKTEPEHHLIKEYQQKVKAYDAYWSSVKLPPKEIVKPTIKKLVDVDFLSLYTVFKKKYLEVTGYYFDGEANNGETKLLAYTLLYYFFNNEKLLKSPLINKTINEPRLSKGLLVFGGFGCGKTSVFKTIKRLFFDAEKNQDVVVKDVDGDDVHLHRYRRSFGYFAANDVVRMYEACQLQEQKDRFWRTMSNGHLYFDDLMTERPASNYGKVELFKDILEIRYDSDRKTIATLNYYVDDNGLTYDTEATLKTLVTKYGNRVYDRAFQMFNIIELNGKSLRL